MKLDEYRTLQRWQRHDTRMMWLERMKRYGSLYAPTHVAALAELIREEVAAEFGFLPDAPAVVAEAEPPWSAADRGAREPRCKACGSWDVRIFTCEAGWSCERCQRPVGDVWGCIGCTRVVCADCIWLAQVPRDSIADLSYEAIGEAWDISRERVRQLLNSILRRLAMDPLVLELHYGLTARGASAERARRLRGFYWTGTP